MLDGSRGYNSNKRDVHNFTTRLQTFKDWPLSLPITAEQMAHAGFVCSGQSDKVQCFSCLLQLSAFEKSEDPFIEYLRHSKSNAHISD